jgi:hypothetical protein
LRFRHHADGYHQDDRRCDLIPAERGVEEAPGDADRSKSLHHFEVAADVIGRLIESIC